MKKTVALLGSIIIALVLISGCSGQNQKPQTVRHIILWTLNDSLSTEQKLELIKSTAADISELEKVIPGVVSLNIYYEGKLESSNCDFMFDFRFDNEDALKSFANNPAHLEAAAKLKPYISGRACLDILE